MDMPVSVITENYRVFQLDFMMSVARQPPCGKSSVDSWASISLFH